MCNLVTNGDFPGWQLHDGSPRDEGSDRLLQLQKPAAHFQQGL